MSFLIFFNFNYGLFSEIFHLRPPYMTFKFCDFLVFECFGGNFWLFENFENVILNIFQF